MHFVNTAEGGLIWPNESLTGGVSADHTLLDTGWDLNWPGAGHVYLNDRDIVDILVASLERDAVAEALKLNGWVAPGAVAQEVFELKAHVAGLEDALAKSKAVEAGFDAALKKLEAAKPKPAAKKTTKE